MYVKCRKGYSLNMFNKQAGAEVQCSSLFTCLKLHLRKPFGILTFLSSFDCTSQSRLVRRLVAIVTVAQVVISAVEAMVIYRLGDPCCIAHNRCHGNFTRFWIGICKGGRGK